jgi:hypothetical protein
VIAERVHAADGDAQKWLAGRWALVAEKRADPKPKAAARKPKARAKRTPARKPAEEIPKCLVQFTKDGKVLLEGDTAALGENLRFVKPLAALSIRMAPQNQYLKIKYSFTGDDTIEVSADYSYLLEQLSAGGRTPLSPEKAKELDREYRPRETLRVSGTSNLLTLTNERGRSLTFRRFTGGSLDAIESKRRADEIRRGLDPFRDILKQQGINIGPPATGKADDNKGTSPPPPKDP